MLQCLKFAQNKTLERSVLGILFRFVGALKFAQLKTLSQNQTWKYISMSLTPKN